MGAIAGWWLANAGTTAVLALTLSLVALGTGWSGLAYGLFALSAVSTVQGLRNLWRQSPWQAVLLAGVVPVMVFCLLAFDGQHARGLLLFVPAALAALAEIGVRRWRLARGLPALAPAVASPERPFVRPARRVAIGCAVLLGLGLAGAALLSYAMTRPLSHARDFHAKLRPGMTLADVAIAAWRHGVWYGFVNDSEGAPPVALVPGGANVGSEQARGEAAVRALLDRHAPALGLVSASFSFRGMVPTRAVVTVHFGPDARVARIDPPRAYAD
jgi:hypothetical protein